MRYESKCERFQAPGPDGTPHSVEFRKGGTLATGDQPELYFFQVDAAEVVVGISGSDLRDYQRARRYLSREEKIDLAGTLLRRRILAGAALVSDNLFIQADTLRALARELDFSD